METQSINIPKLGWSLAEIEVATGLSRATLYRMANDGQLETVKVRGRRLVPDREAQKLFSPEGSA